MISWFRGLLWAALSFALAMPHPASAQTDESPDALIDRGVAMRRAGDDEGALALFVTAWERGRAPRARAQMALAEQALGQFVDAEAHLLEAMQSESDPWIAARRTDLLLALESLREHLGALEIEGGVDGAEIRIDGQSAGTLPLARPLRLRTGTYRLEVVARRYYPVTRTVTILPDGVARELLVMTPRPTSSTDDEDGAVEGVDATARSAAGRGSRVLPFVVLGAGAALLATSGTFFAVRQSRAREFNGDGCLAGGMSRAENCQDVHDGAVRAQRTSYATLGLGVAAVAAGSVWFALGREADDDTAPTASACSVMVGAGAAGSCRWSF